MAIQERRDCAQGQGGVCCKRQKRRSSRQTAAAEEMNRGASFPEENRPGEGWGTCVYT